MKPQIAQIELPKQFTVALYRFTLTALDPLEMNPVKSSALRGAFGSQMKALVCRWPNACQEACQGKNSCPYGYIFETSPPDDSVVLRKLQNVPRPFIFRTPEDRRTHLPAGAQFSFELVLIGYCIRLLPYFVAIFQTLGNQGLGRNRGRFHLAKVEALSPYQNQSALVYDAGSGLIREVDASVNAEDTTDHAQQFSSTSQLTINFLTPAQLVEKRKKILRDPPFAVLIRTLLARVSSLSSFHCGEAFEVDFRALIDQASTVSIANQDVEQTEWSRFSNRQKQRIEMGGFMGSVTYTGDLGAYIPLLALGELIHVGKKTVFGNGQYKIETETRP